MKDYAHSSWLSRHWRWLAPVVCVVVLLAAGIFHVVHIAANAVSVVDLYREATADASRDPNVIAALGQPITVSLQRFNARQSESSKRIQGNRVMHSVSGTATLTIELAGPKDVATLHILATRSTGHWNYQLLAVDTSHQQHIDLLQGIAAKAAKHI